MFAGVLVLGVPKLLPRVGKVLNVVSGRFPSFVGVGYSQRGS